MTGALDGTARIWQVGRDDAIAVFSDHETFRAGVLDGVHCVRWSPDGAFIASGGGGDLLRIWRPLAAQACLTLAGHGESINDLAWGPECDRIVVATGDGSLRLWELVIDQQQLLDIARSRAVRDLTDAERWGYGLAGA